MSQRTNVGPPVLLGPLIRLALIRSFSRAVGAPSGAHQDSGTGDDFPMNDSHMFYEGKVLGMTDDGLMAYSSLVFGVFAAYQWRREAQIASLIAYAAVCSYAEHILRYELLTWLDRAAAVSLAIVLVRRVGFIPRRCHLAVAALLWATCDILYGNLSRPLYVSLHTCGQRRNHPVVRASSTLRDCTRRDATQALARVHLDLRLKTPARLTTYTPPRPRAAPVYP